ncbi:hypothetical protein [Flavobacterium sp.]|uniref:hypothetical protein n=1 Tax=Flavobacterium sp. TaxID=239 RepID=UPI00374FEB86
MQRVFFKEKAIKVTKGFFLNHFSKREDNASYENQKNEIDLWKNDLHELCYHSLSQSIKSDDDSFSDFENFEPPYLDIPTWIDHGYQPYNFSLYKNFNKEDAYFESVLIKKNITILWNYIDCGTATRGVINQLNGSHFTLSSFLKGNKNLSFIKRMQLMIKNIIFHYYATQDIILKYKSLAQNFKNIIYKKQIMLVFKLVSNFISISKPILAVFLGWNKHKNTPFKYAKYSPIFFKHRIAEKEFYIFQTLEMVDFKKSLSKENIDLLLQEKGLFIAHTYFSVPMNYHQGKMFATTSKIDQEVAANFNYLSENIKNNNIWNPTISELIGYMKNFENSILDINPEGTILVKSSANLLFRTVD